MFEKISLCFDSNGCPNRCRHCWIGHKSNEIIEKEKIIEIVKGFTKYANRIEVYSWIREPDYSDNYKEQWELDNELSVNSKPQRFELLSFYRLVRDKEYINWLKKFDIKKYQLTLFGKEETTDYYVGRKGAYKEILEATNILLNNGLLPRWQMFIYKNNLDEIDYILSLIESMNLKERCLKNGGEFEFFIHTGSCDGENRNNYDQWIEKSDIKKIPKQYFIGNLIEEKILFESLLENKETAKLNNNNPIFYIDNEFNVYPNFSDMSEHWKLGNLNIDSIENIIQVYSENMSPAQYLRNNIPLSELVSISGDSKSNKLFTENDYIDYLVNSYFINMYMNRKDKKI
ncbi:MAG: radical SAM protein [Firmicutes bacterium]|nr:radical SAM protein [Bacillota bacterium]